MLVTTGPAGETDLASLQSVQTGSKPQPVLYSISTAELSGRFHRQKWPGSNTHRSPSTAEVEDD